MLYRSNGQYLSSHQLSKPEATLKRNPLINIPVRPRPTTADTKGSRSTVDVRRQAEIPDRAITGVSSALLDVSVLNWYSAGASFQ